MVPRRSLGGRNGSDNNGSKPPVLIVQDDVDERTVNFEGAVVFDKAKAPELVHEKADSRTGRADHLRQHFLIDPGNYLLRLSVFSEIGQQEECSRKSFFAGVEELVYQILLYSYTA